MRRVGTVVRALDPLVVAQSVDESHPEIGTDLIDEELSPVGTVVDVFGPVERPYLTISPNTDHTPRLVGTVVYAR